MFHGVSHQISRKKAAEILNKSGFPTATPLQKAAFSAASAGRNLVAEYSPGEGKTLSFLIPALMGKGTLIITDTEKEISKIKTVLKELISSSSVKIRYAFLKESENIQKEIHLLEKNPAIIVGSSTRIIDHIRRNNLKLEKITSLVVDITEKADRDFFDKDILFVSTKLAKRATRSVFIPDYRDIGALEEILKRPVLSLKTARNGVKHNQTIHNPQENSITMKEDQAKEKIEQFISIIKDSEDPIVLKEYKKLIKKNVPFHLRGYFTAFLFKTLADKGGRIPKRPQAASGMQTVFINIGKNRKVYHKDLFRLIQKTLDVDAEKIGTIKVLGNYSFVDMEPSAAAAAVEKMDGTMFRGKKLTVNFARKKD